MMGTTVKDHILKLKGSTEVFFRGISVFTGAVEIKESCGGHVGHSHHKIIIFVLSNVDTVVNKCNRDWLHSIGGWVFVFSAAEKF
jgi:hypothetical protein